jgi:hypothetical protein
MRRTWLVAAIVLGVLAIVIAALVMRLTEDDPETTQEWAGQVCTSLSDWRASIIALADVGGEPLTADSLRERLSDAEEATSELASELRDLGPPDLDAGDVLEEELNGATAQLQASFENLKEGAESAADAPAGEFLAELAALAPDFAALQEAVAQTVTTLRDADIGEESKAELEQAFAASPSCQSLPGDDS